MNNNKKNSKKVTKNKFFKWFSSNFTKTKKNKSHLEIHFGWTRRKTKNIVKGLLNQNIDILYFYTSVKNVFYILEHGIVPIRSKKMKAEENYVIWTYLEKQTKIELELSSTTRHHFWTWCLENKVSLHDIAIFYIDIKLLYENTSRDWEFSNSNQRISISEVIKPNTINAILVKDHQAYLRLQQYLEHQKSNIKVFFGKKGAIE